MNKEKESKKDILEDEEIKQNIKTRKKRSKMNYYYKKETNSTFQEAVEKIKRGL